MYYLTKCMVYARFLVGHRHWVRPRVLVPVASEGGDESVQVRVGGAGGVVHFH